jgi:hypothetical protein
MFIADDAAYYAAREQAARKMAHDAKDTVAWLAHFAMAREYRRLAVRARTRAAATSALLMAVQP